MLLLWFIAASFLSAGGAEIRFEELPKLVRDRNASAQASSRAAEAVVAREGYLRRSFLPRISVKAGQESAKVGAAAREELGYWSAEARINIFSGGRDRLEEGARRAESEAAKTRAGFEFHNELLKARKNYWHLTATLLLIEDLREAIHGNDENIKAARKRLGAGVTTAADAVQFELEKTILVQNLKRLEHEEDVLKNRLSVLLGLSEHKELRVEKRIPHPPEAEFQEREIAAEENLEVRMFRKQADSEKLRARQSNRWFWPKFDLYARHGQPSLSDDYTLAVRKETESIAGVNLTLDLGQAFHDRAESLAQAQQSQSYAARAEHRAREVRADSHELQHDLRLLHELLHDADADVERARNFLRLTKSEYARGVKNGPDLREAFLKLYEFRRRKIELGLEYQSAKAELEALTAR